MKYIKTFETLHSKPKIGDFVLCDENHYDDIFTTFLSNNIGKIIKIIPDYDYPYIIEYNNIPNDIKEYFYYSNLPNDMKEYFNYPTIDNIRRMSNNNIIHCSDDKYDLEVVINTNKFNI